MQFRDLKAQYAALKPEIDAAIQSVIDSSAFILGKPVTELEDKLAAYVGRKHCVGVASGTEALQLALMAMDVGPGDAVFTSDFTYFASAGCASIIGATPVLVDIDLATFNMSPEALETAIKRVHTEGKLTPKVIIPVDLFGLPADYPAIRAVCDRYGLLLLEDGAQGFGGSIGAGMACSFGDIATTSFFPAKPLGCYGDGGAIFTDNDEWADLIRSICVHGKDTGNPDDPNAKYNNVRLGKNSRLDTIQAAVLLPKLKAFADYELADVNRATSLYMDLLKDTDLILPVIPEGFRSSWAQFTVQLPEGADRAAVQAKLKAAGIPAMVYYAKPMHLQGAFAGTDSAQADCPVTEDLCRRVLSLPLDPYKTTEEIASVAGELKKALGAA